ncbi:MAG TPA: PH domain-containing protein [Pseudonocardiaceae bacterium]|jgi:hypothetical protein|nr:PH domain-containing protein [Pseudonocardiaceae bacterium]
MMTTDRQAQWSPRPALVVIGWLAALALLATTVFSGLPETRLFTGVATIAFVLAAGYGTLLRPKLHADADGMVVRLLNGRLHLPWHSTRISVARTRRLGRTVALLELDGRDDLGEEQLVVLGWLELGTDPDDVLEVLRALRP